MITLAGVVHAQSTVTLYGLIDTALTDTNNQVTAERVVDIVSHANLVQSLASVPDEPVSDATVRDAETGANVMGELAGRKWGFAGRNCGCARRRASMGRLPVGAAIRCLRSPAGPVLALAQPSRRLHADCQ
jgi:hypothetical protein